MLFFKNKYKKFDYLIIVKLFLLLISIEFIIQGINYKLINIVETIIINFIKCRVPLLNVDQVKISPIRLNIQNKFNILNVHKM